jgi:APA family basic amino acid/polyamine antiporter
MSTQQTAAPRASLSTGDGVAMMVGLIIGVGIFKLPFLVAMNVDSSAMFIGLWVLGGVVTLIGAFVYSELAAAYPSTGGEYHFLSRAYGSDTALLFAWARTTVIQTGAIAAVSFVFGDYAQQLWPLGPYGPAIYAAAALVFITLINLAGTHESKNAQIVFTILEVGAVVFVAFVGFTLASPAPSASVAPSVSNGSLGLAIVFILFTYGGWNEAAYLSRDVRDVHRTMIRILVAGTLIVTLLYVAVNLAYLHVLGLEGVRKAPAIAADVMRAGLGPVGAVLLSLFVCCAALSTINASVFTGARVYHALGEDLAVRSLSFWSAAGNNPRNAIYIQSAISLGLIAFGAATKEGFEAMVAYTAPVFWFFLFLVGLSAIVLRRRDGAASRPFRMPFYPLTPLLLCLTCLWLFYSSIRYAGMGALLGVAVLALGVPLLLFARKRR